VIFRRSQHQQSAWELLEFLSRPEIQRRFYDLTGDLPPRRSSWQSGAIATDPYTQAFRTQLERLRTFPQVPEWEEIMQEMRVMAERVVQKQQDLDSAVTAFDAQVDDMLSKRRWMLARQQSKGAPAP
jgi:multiple sugar transport system substrate-binding protein